MEMIKKLVIGFALFFIVFGFMVVFEYGPEITSGAIAWGGPKCVKADRAEKLIGNGWCEQTSDRKCEARGRVMVDCSGANKNKEEKKEEIKQKIQDWREARGEKEKAPEIAPEAEPIPAVEPEQAPATETEATPEPAPEPEPEPEPEPQISEPIVTTEDN